MVGTGWENESADIGRMRAVHARHEEADIPGSSTREVNGKS